MCAGLVALSTGSAGTKPDRPYFGTYNGARADGPTTVSTNWAGYAVADPVGSTSSTAFTSVTGTWKQPRAKCSVGKVEYSATWVGLGGFTDASRALEQVGTSADCRGTKKPTYYAWYELVPAPSVKVKFKITAGDVITTSVNVNGSSVLVQLKNRTKHTVFTKQLVSATPDLSSAEWIEEAPAACSGFGSCHVLSLANFGKVSMTKSATIGSTHPGTISDPAWQATAIQLVPGSNDPSVSPAGASPSALTADGRGFDVLWQPNAGG